MTGDKYSATWVSHTSISDFKQCPRAYFLKHVYKDPISNHKVKLISPPLSLGQAVHEVIEGLSILPVERRFDVPLVTLLETTWKKIAGKKGGFISKDVEASYKSRAEEMLKRVTDHPGPIERQAVKIKMDLPHFWLSEEENIILCGKLDWLEYLPKSNGVHIIDFKTGKKDEDSNSLQLPIYFLLAKNCQSREVGKVSYWYLQRNDDLTPCALPDGDDSFKKVLDVARKIKLARSLQKFSCPSNGCNYCNGYEAILNNEAEFVGNDEYGADVYVAKNENLTYDSSVIL